MYRFNKRIYKQKNKYLFFLFLIILIIGLGGYGYYYLSRSTTNIKQSSPVIKYFKAPSSNNQTILEPDFSFSLPGSWRAVTVHSTLYKIYQFESTVGSSEVLDIYQDTIPVNLPVNRELVVQAAGNHLSNVGSVSSNCVNFTKPTNNGSSNGVPARWQGINFICDTANFERDVVGTGSTNGINSVKLDSPTIGSHLFFFTLTDYGINPNYTVLYQVVNSFRIK